jgi:hypothetical protein
MSMESGQERLYRQLLSTRRCSNCRHRFERNGFAVMAKHEKLWVISAHCSACNKMQVFWVSLKGGIELAPQELTAGERQRLEALPAITPDDVLAMHEFLGDFDGDFQTLFARRV